MAKPKKKSKNKLTLAPVQGKSADELRWEMEGKPKLPLSDAERELLKRKLPFQFSVAELAMVLTVAAVSLAGYQWLPFPYYTAACGLASFGFLIASNIWSDGFLARFSRMSLVVLLTIYLICCVIVVVRG